MANYAVSTAFRAIDNVSSAFIKMGNNAEVFKQRASKSFREASNAGLSFKSVIGGILGAGLVQQGFQFLKRSTIGSIEEVAKLGDELAKTGRVTGLTAEALQELGFAAEREGISNESLIGSFEKLTRNIGDLRNGTGTLYTLLGKNDRAFGSQLMRVKDTEQAFIMLIDKISKTKDPFKRASLATAAFGRSGQDMIKFVQGGTKNIAELRQEARRLGIMTNKSAGDSETLSDSIGDLKFAFRGLQITLISEYMPSITKVVELVKEFIVTNKDVIKTNIKSFFTGVKNAIDILVPILKTAYDVFSFLSPVIYTTIGALVALKVAMAIGSILAWIKNIAFLAQMFIVLSRAEGIASAAAYVFNSALLANPITWIVVGIGAAVAVTWMLIKHWDKVVSILSTAWDWFKKIFDLFAGGVMKIGGDIWAGITGGYNEATREATTPQRQAPNQVEVMNKNKVEVGGTFNFANAPKGSSFSSSGAKGIDYSMLGAN